MSLKKENNLQPEKKPAVKTWQPDPWPARSEEFYAMVYKGGKCRYCGKIIHTHLDICGCHSMIVARERFKRLVRAGMVINPGTMQDTPKDNPDRNHSMDIEIEEIPF